ncbi:response regulator [Paenibacillus sp. sptzw28]|uniref:response regulator transcription factor n=1 Tax=Paenibacillus sp. sptzw28 TaxID=715179 RepID=UPI001C6EC9D2|nr:response regulator [Paenibacillus sp. sptzw28]QYR19498.1 response regulator [Paenibacillus sp. sptzw28]
MFSVLVVDDEPRHRRGLTLLIKELRPEYRIYDAKDGAEAIRCIDSNLIDIIITDIQMPTMNGLQLMESLGSRCKEMSIVILSAYSNFEYAQKAVRLGAFDYLLKPVGESKVEQILKDIENKVKAESAENCDVLMAKLLRGTITDNELKRLHFLFPPGGRGIVLVAEIGFQRSGDADPQSAADEERVRQEVKNNLQRILADYGQHAAFFLPDNIDRIVTVISTPEQQAPFPAPAHAARLNEFIRSMSAEYGIEVTIGAGTEFKQMQSEAGHSYKLAVNALRCKFYTGGGRVVCGREMDMKRKLTAVKIDPRRLAEALLQADKARVTYVIDASISRSFTDGYPNPERFVYSFANAVMHSIALYEEKLKALLAPDFTDELMQCKDIGQLRDTAIRMLHGMIDMLRGGRGKRNEAVIEACKAYIEEHFADELSLGFLARKFHFNASYFCLLFKNHTQTNISDYILKIRMRRAEHLLLNTSRKIYEIAKMVGYQDVKYFTRLFRKEYGAAPDEYRHRTVSQ